MFHKKWTIQGSSGNIYTRENITDPHHLTSIVIRSCTCPTFKYSTNKTCKYTNQKNP